MYGGNGSRLKRALFPLRSDSLITVLSAAACRHTGGGGWGWGVWNTHSHRCLQYKSMHTPRETRAYTQWQKALSALRDYLPVSSTNHFKCPCLRDIVWLYHGTTASSWLCSHFQTFSSFQINFLHQNSFYLPIILFSYYLRCPPGKISVTERRGRREEMSCDGEQSALQLEVQGRGPQTLIGIILILLSCIIGRGILEDVRC